MIAFHLTKRNYEEGKTYSVDAFNGVSNYHVSLDDNQKAINDAIDCCRSQNEPSRKKCFYTFEEKNYCIGFFQSLDGYHLYQVDINTNTPHPMYLLDFLNRNKHLLHSLAYVYWDEKLTKEFKVKEFIGTEISIIRKVILPINNSLQRVQMVALYNDDRDTCISLCRRMGLQYI